MKFSLLLILVLAFSTCSEDEISYKNSDLLLNQDIVLNVHECFSNETIEICVDSVSSDSRCPSDVVCVWEGNASVDFSVTIEETEHQLRLNTHLSERFVSDTIIGDYHIFLLDLSPYPMSTTSIKQSDYSASLKIELIEE